MKKPKLDLDVEYHYRKGRIAHAQGKGIDSCPYSYANLKAYCAWMGGWHDYNNGGE